MAAVTFVTVPARADAHADAQKAFDEGRRLRDDPKPDLVAALAAFRRSAQAERSIGALYNIGYCNEKLGRMRDALDAYRDARALADQRKDARLVEIDAAIDEIRRTHHFVKIIVPSVVATAEGLRIELDGITVPSSQFDGEVFRPAGGTHQVLVEANGRKHWSKSAMDAEPVTVELGEPITSPNLVPGGPRPPVAVAPTSGSDLSWRHWTGIGLAGTGVAMGVVTLVVGLNLQSEVDAKFDEAAPCAANGSCPDKVRSYNEAKDSWPTRVLPFGIVAGALLAGGAVVYFTAPNATGTAIRMTPSVGPGHAGVSLSGAF